MAKLAVLGAGSWGTALAINLASVGHEVLLWTRSDQQAKAMQQSKSNERYLPGVTFSSTLTVTSSLNQALGFANTILLAIPSIAFKTILEQIKSQYVSQRFICAIKGFDDQGNFLHDTFHQVLGPNVIFAMLGGPSFAKEVAMGLPTAITIASKDLPFAQELAGLFSHQVMRAYTSTDIIGVQIGGAIKNVLAIAAGISDGLGYGANARAALITRGLAEMMRIGEKLGAKSETLMGLAGVGDLVLTCTDDKSRNRRFGLLLGKGLPQEQALKEIKQVVEGMLTAKHIHHLAAQYQVEMPIIEQVYQVLFCQRSAEQAVKNLLARPIKEES